MPSQKDPSSPLENSAQAPSAEPGLELRRSVLRTIQTLKMDAGFRHGVRIKAI